MTVDPTILVGPARRIQTLMTSGLVLLLALTTALTLGAIAMPASLGETLAHLSGFPVGPLQTWQNGVLTGVAAIYLAIWIMLLGIARRVFGHLANGKPEAAARAAQVLSYWLWTLLAWGLISRTLVSLVVTWSFPEGERALVVAIGMTEASLAFSALIAGFMARAFALGAELWRDHQKVV